jgi:Flp pilus assembly protein TadD/predicted aspartyl protease
MILPLRFVVRCSLGSLFLLPPGGISATQSTTSEQAPATTATTSKSAQTDPGAPSQSPSDDALSQAQALYRKGDFDGALQKFQQTLQSQPKSSDAYVGLTRVYLKKKDVQLASDTINKALQIADSPAVRVVLGEVCFRQGKLHEAENEWLNVANSGSRDPQVYLGLAKMRWASSMYKSARALIDRARELGAEDSEIRLLSAGKLTRRDRIKFLEEYLAGENNGDAETRANIQRYLEYLKARARVQHGACHLASTTATTETPMIRLMRDPNHIRGYGLEVGVNNRKSQLLLDTGASGIVINRPLAEKSGVTRLSDTQLGGIGDRGGEKGYIGLAHTLKIGELEFRDCEVEVLDRRSVVGEDGLIGSDVFSSFLVDLDFPVEKVRLMQLPKRPDDSTSTVALQTESDDSVLKGEEEDASENPDQQASSVRKGPQDRYIAPEMQSFTRVYRFGHDLLVPTYVGDENAPVRLFLLDTGAFDNQITLSTAREITHVHDNPLMKVQGISGDVNRVYRAERAIIRFGHIRHYDKDLVTFDLAHTSDDVGTEVSGILGFQMLRLLDIKINYRDGLVDFSYDPKRFNH